MMRGHPPKVAIQPIEEKEYEIPASEVAKLVPELNWTEEQKKYVKCWQVDDYRKVAPGEGLVDLFMETAVPRAHTTVVDWGCGTGRASRKLYDAGLDVTMVDFAFNCLDDDIAELAKGNDRLRFIEHDLNKRISLPSEYGFCTDVMEHIPEDEIDAVLDTILDNSRHVFFQISTKNDVMGHHPDIRS
jgi:2-polyprenyl-3-methyl-5-hydroxy-6-metoxy-1,4-benzoquinol methylase